MIGQNGYKHKGFNIEGSDQKSKSSLDSRRCNTLDEHPLKEEVEDDNGQRDGGEIGHNLAPGDIQLEEVLQANHDRPELLGLDDDEGPHILVPHIQRPQDGRCGDDRSRYGKDDFPINHKPSGSIDSGGFHQIHGDFLEKLIKQEDLERIGQ